MQVYAKTSAKGGSEETAAGGGSHKGEWIEVNLNGAGGRTLVDHDVDAVVLHGRVEIFLHHWRQAVNLINE